MLAAAVIGLWKRLIDREKECKAEREAKDLEIKALTKELVATARGLDLLRERHEQLRAASSSPPRSS